MHLVFLILNSCLPKKQKRQFISQDSLESSEIDTDRDVQNVERTFQQCGYALIEAVKNSNMFNLDNRKCT